MLGLNPVDALGLNVLRESQFRLYAKPQMVFIIELSVIALQTLPFNSRLTEDASYLAGWLLEQFRPAKNLSLFQALIGSVRKSNQPAFIQDPVQEAIRHLLNSVSDVNFGESSGAADSASHSNLLKNQ